ncbi:SDR family NAD(P)-dependent oxidoreductase [Mycolicibacterium parafortuitum]|uniref:Beta-ketoacyl-ACP reductase n=1 Tax=Mycolicibacterium parafortuitum TaxID=39692 RepID=A0A375YM40_MYCPF|nr:SDR family oxidoreductase [Mycolicibacterium parafortuitum]ORB29981.1 oxidoreductase [Mycolicibacterium parafortuitum]PQE02313.1 NAD(P)-dependent oxidoreductase [Mycobacterium sp. EPG1]BBY77364.1 beta-ketoacyl-ACP reductase [Mycolicibacterium parafortuitum]SRX82123.1 short-chain dehydrogenase [Parvularcula bermudensis] [Mycolicibacterium parafortuitum]
MLTRTAVVTGGSGGIGKACGRHLAASGYDVVLIARREAPLRAAADEIGARHIVADVTSPAAFGDAVSSLSRIDLLVHAAGVLDGTYARKQTFDQWRTTMSANLDSCFVVTQAALPLMQAGSRFIFISSSAAHEPMPGRTAYSASKAGMNAFARALALEVDRDGINVNIVTPGPVETDMLTDVPFAMYAVTPDDVAQAVVFLDTVPAAVDMPEICLNAITRGPHARPPTVPKDRTSPGSRTTH